MASSDNHPVPKAKVKELARKESTHSLIEGKRGSTSSGTDLEPLAPGTPPRVQKKFIDNWRHACDKTRDRTKELLKKWRTLPEHANEEDLTPSAIEEQTGWSEHVWTTWVKRYPSGSEDYMENQTTATVQLTPHQKQKLCNFFIHHLDMDRDDVISLSDFEALFERFRHFADWSKNSPEYHRLLEVQRGFIEYFLVPRELKGSYFTYSAMEKTIRKEQLELDMWLQKWSEMLSETHNFLQLPLWLQFFPQILFQVVNKSGSGMISAEELSSFYSSVVGLSELELSTCMKNAYKTLTSNGSHPLDANVYRLCFANFVLGRFPHGPGQYLLYPAAQSDSACFPIDYKAMSSTPRDLEQYSPVVKTNRRSVVV